MAIVNLEKGYIQCCRQQLLDSDFPKGTQGYLLHLLNRRLEQILEDHHWFFKPNKDGTWLIGPGNNPQTIPGTHSGLHHIHFLLKRPRKPISAVEIENRGDLSVLLDMTRTENISMSMPEDGRSEDDEIGDEVEEHEQEFETKRKEFHHEQMAWARSKLEASKERIRKSVARTIKRLRESCHDDCKPLLDHLDLNISISVECEYFVSPDEKIHWILD